MKRRGIVALSILLLLAAACGRRFQAAEVIAHFYGPTQMAIDPDPHRTDGALLYVLNTAGAALSILNAHTQEIIKAWSSDPYDETVLRLGRAPLDIAITPSGELLYITDTWRDRVRTVATADPWTITKTDLVLEGARVSIAPATLDVDTHRPVVPAAWDARHEVWFTDPVNSRLLVWDHAAGRLVDEVALPSPPVNLRVSGDGERVFVVGEDATLRVVDAADRSLTDIAVSLDGRPDTIVESRDGAYVYVLNIDPPQVHVIRTADWRETEDEITFPMAVNGMAMSTDGKLGFITSDDGYLYYFFVGARRACGSSATHPYFFDQGPRGDPTIENVETVDCVTRKETWTITYRLDLLAWEVEGAKSGLQTNLAYTNQAYISDQGELKFFIRAGDYRESDGDYFQFDTNVGVAPVPMGAIPTGVAVTPDLDLPQYDNVFVADTAGESVDRIFTKTDKNENGIQ